MPALTVLLPVSNGAAHLDEAIESLRRQTFADFELLVIDDGSSDHSMSIAERHARNDVRVQPLANPGRGLVTALNFGIARASAALIARMDADDVALPVRFERQFLRMQAEPDLLVLGTSTIHVDASGHRLGVVTPPEDSDEISRVLRNVNPMAHPSVVMRSDALRQVGGYRPAYLRAEDYDLWLRLAERGKLANLREPLLQYRVARQFRTAMFSRQVLSEMAARAAADLRRRGQPDLTAGWDDLDIDRLALLGIPPETISSETARRALHEARRYAKMKDRDNARAALRMADAQPRRGAVEAVTYFMRRSRVFL